MKSNPPASDYGTPRSCRAILVHRSECGFQAGSAWHNRMLELRLAMEWCKANGCRLHVGKSPTTMRWEYAVVIDPLEFSGVLPMNATTPMAAVRQMQKWMADNPKEEP